MPIVEIKESGLCLNAAQDHINALLDYAKSPKLDGGGLVGFRVCIHRHIQAWNHPQGIESAFVRGLQALATYADVHRQEYESPVGEDGLLGDYWLDWLESIMRLRDGALARLDAGLLGELGYNMAKRAGFSDKDLKGRQF